MIDGVNTKVEVTEKMFSEELKELIQKKETIINDLGEKQSKQAIAYLKSNKYKREMKIMYQRIKALGWVSEDLEKRDPSPIEKLL